MSILGRLRNLLHLAGRQDGFTMLNVMFAMMALGTFSVSAWALTTGDIPMARADQDHKRAYEAAQAGLQWYAYELDRDSAYWTKCDPGQISPASRRRSTSRARTRASGTRCPAERSIRSRS